MGRMNRQTAVQGAYRMKRLLSLLPIAILILALAISAGCSAGTKERGDNDEAINAFVVRLFTAVDQVDPFSLPAGLSVNEGVSEYIAGKIEERRITYEATQTQLRDYAIEVDLAETKEGGDNLIAKRFNVVVAYHYEGLESIDSGYGREVELLIRTDDQGGLTLVGIRVLGILDAYDSYLYEDVAGEGAVELSDPEGVKEKAGQYLRDAAASFGK